jgi:RIO kinase 2
MRLDLSSLKYLTQDDFRVLTAIEMGMRNHEIVPVTLIDAISKLKKGSVFKVIANLLKHKLIEHSNLKYDGYSLNYIGYDYLAINTLMKRGILVKIGQKIGVGKESDVFVCYVNPKNIDSSDENHVTDEEYNRIKNEIIANNDEHSEHSDDSLENPDINEEEEHPDIIFNKFEQELQLLDTKCVIAVLKLARLGRTSFRAVKSKRDYVKGKSHYNWLYLSRISAINEFKFMKGLFQCDFPVPKPYGHNRHAILMEFIPSYPLCRIEDLGNKEKAFNDLLSLILKFAQHGLIHGDFNEFNILVSFKNQKMFIIDFPQMVSIAHEDALKFFLRDIHCINKFFYKKFGLKFEETLGEKEYYELMEHRIGYLDIKLQAYGYQNALNKMNEEEIKQQELIKNSQLLNENDDGDQDSDMGDLLINDLQDEDLLKHDKEKEEKEEKVDKPRKQERKISHNLDFEEEINEDVEIQNPNKQINSSNKIEIDMKTIKDKVKKMLQKSAKSQVCKTSNRFKAKKKAEKAKVDKD